jgi:hypothetical protein
MRDTLEKYGFFKTDECKCSGTVKESWQHPCLLGVLVEIKPYRNKFELWRFKKLPVNGNGSTFEGEIKLLFEEEKGRIAKARKRNASRKCCGKE